jgi:hypothetical protein
MLGFLDLQLRAKIICSSQLQALKIKIILIAYRRIGLNVNLIIFSFLPTFQTLL